MTSPNSMEIVTTSRRHKLANNLLNHNALLCRLLKNRNSTFSCAHFQLIVG